MIRLEKTQTAENIDNILPRRINIRNTESLATAGAEREGWLPLGGYEATVHSRVYANGCLLGAEREQTVASLLRWVPSV